MHKKNHPDFLTINPKILYFGTPVALITTTDADRSPNIGPVSSVWALGYNLMLGLGCNSKTFHNLISSKECVVNLPSPDLFEKIEGIASLTGLNPVPESKSSQYQYEPNKFAAGNFQMMSSEKVNPPAIADCPLQLESILQSYYIMEYGADGSPLIAAMQLKVINVRAHENLVINQNQIDPSLWSPLIYNFRHYYALGEKMGKNFRAEQ